MNALKMILLAGLIFTTHLALAQRGSEGQRDKMAERKMAEELSLTKEQQEKLTEIRETFKSEMKEISASEEWTKEEKVAKMEEALAKRHEQSDAVYTLEQKAQMESIRREKNAERLVNRGERSKTMKVMREEMKTYYDQNMEPELAKMRRDFDSKLTDEDKELISKWKAERPEHKAQKEQHKKAIESGETKRDKHKEESQEQMRGKRGNANEKRSEMKAMLEKYDDELKTIKEANAELFDRWEADQKAIAQKYKSDEVKQKDRKMRSRYRQVRQRNHQKGDYLGVRFLLMDF